MKSVIFMGKKLLATILIILLAVTLFCSCKNEIVNDIATYYCLKGSASYVDMIINDYNQQCESSEDKIKIVEFETEEELANKMITEIMAGKGPDIMGGAVLSWSTAPVEKLINQGVFLDLNQLIKSDKSVDKLNFEDYHPEVMSAGIVNFKRYFVPTTFTVDAVTVSTEKLKEYLNKNFLSGDVLSYQEMIELDNNFLGQIFQQTDYYKKLFFNCINQQVDVHNLTMDFDDKEFIETINQLKNVVNTNPLNDSYLSREKYLFCCVDSSPFDMGEDIAKIRNKGETPLILNLPTKDGTASAKIRDGIFVNKNSKHTEIALKFIKYALSEEVQGNYTGADVVEYDPHNSNGLGLDLPVHKVVLEKLLNKIYEVSYDKAQAENYLDSLEITTNDLKITQDNLKQIKSYINSIENYEFSSTYEYYNNNVINDTVEKFLNSEITLPTFISQLKSKTELYLNE